MRRFTRNETWLQMSKQVKNKWGQSTFLFNYFWQMYDLHTSINGLGGGCKWIPSYLSSISAFYDFNHRDICSEQNMSTGEIYSTPPKKTDIFSFDDTHAASGNLRLYELYKGGRESRSKNPSWTAFVWKLCLESATNVGVLLHAAPVLFEYVSSHCVLKRP